MSASIRPISPPQPSSASVTTTTVSSSSPPTTNRSTGEGPSAAVSSSSVSTPPPPHVIPGPAAGIQQVHHPHPHAHAQPHHQPIAHQHQHQHQHRASHPSSHGGPAGTTPSSSDLSSGGPPRASPLSSSSSPTNPSQLPTQAQQAQVSQARAALVASIGNMLDHELQTRAELLHANQAAIERQERGVERALEGLRREDDRLLKLLNRGSKQVKELGDVQNWAERMETDFLVLEETMRLVNRGGGGGASGSESGSGSWSGSGSGSWSGSDAGSVVGDEDGDVRMQDGGAEDGVVPDGGEGVDKGKGKGKQVDMASSVAMDVDPAQVPLPLDDEAVVDSALPAPPSDYSTAAAQPSPPEATGWFRRMMWRT